MQLDDAYANGAYIDGAAAYPDRWDDAAMEYRETEHSFGRARLNVPYGPDDRQAFDLFYPSGCPKGLAVFVHGGYWKAFDRKTWSHFAEGLALNDWAVAMPSYPLAPDATIPDITISISQAIEKASEMIPGPIVLTGHSAGGHLVARMAMGDGLLRPDTTARLQKIVPISALGDLRPLMETTMNEDLKLTHETALAESPSLHSKGLDVPVHVWVGGDERPVFIEQSRTLAAAWQADLTVQPGLHHFDIIDGLCDPDSDLVRAVDQV